jgi:two-component system, chemotaxis family, sensor kinase Cph1
MPSNLSARLMIDRPPQISRPRPIWPVSLSQPDLLEQLTNFQRLNHDLESFVYAASHDLREPIRNSEQALFFLESALKIGSMEEVPLRLADVRFSLQRMTEMIQAVRRLARIGSADLNLQPIRLSEVVDQGAEITIGRHAPVDVPIAVERDDVVYADFMCLRELFVNLFTNALWYNNSPNKQIQIGRIPSQKSPLNSTTSVLNDRDNGIGIAEDTDNWFSSRFESCLTRWKFLSRNLWEWDWRLSRKLWNGTGGKSGSSQS